MEIAEMSLEPATEQLLATLEKEETSSAPMMLAPMPNLLEETSLYLAFSPAEELLEFTS